LKEKKPNNIFFLGVGGIGMSALARHFLKEGFRVWGYDRFPGPLTLALEKEGVDVIYEDNPEMLKHPFSGLPNQGDEVVFTPAIRADNRLFQHFQNSGFPLKKRSEKLGEILSDSFQVSVAGTHGKTTTSCLISHLLHRGAIPFSAFLGGVSTDLGSNFFSNLGVGDRLISVAEADEFDRSFLKLSPDIAVVTSMDPDHLDVYGTAGSFESGFLEFTKKIKGGGILVFEHSLSEKLGHFPRKWSYGIGGGDLSALNLREKKGHFVFDAQGPDFFWKEIELQIPGLHNVKNALASILVAVELGVKEGVVREALMDFRGVKRRFEYLVKKPGSVYIDDYAHHPSEIEALLQSVRMLFPGKKITGIYSRTRDFADGFARSLGLLDSLWLMDIYPAREEPIPGVSSQLILDRVKIKDKSIVSRKEILDRLESGIPEILLTIGAGDIDREVDPIKKMIERSLENEI
jgi:UDP-N-acetylmuramate--alanine ligase